MFKSLMMAAALTAGFAAPALAIDTFNLGGAAKGDPSVVWYKFAGQDVVAVFVRGPGDLMYAQVGDETGSTWTNWAPIGTQALKGSPSCVAFTTSLIDCFGVGSGNNVWHIRYNAKTAVWTNWENLGGFATSDPSAVRTIDGGAATLRVFVGGPGNQLFMNSFVNGSWTDWQNRDIVIGGNPGCTDILVFGAHCYDTSGGGAKQFSNLTMTTGPAIFIDQLGGAITRKAAPVATGAKGDTLRVFVNGPGKRLWVKTWHLAWSNWVEIPVTINSAPACAIKKSGGDAWCASVEANGTVKMILLDDSEI